MLNRNRKLYESKKTEYFVSEESWQGFKVYKIENGTKYYLSKLTKNITSSVWTSDHTYAKYYKNRKRAEEIKDLFENIELNESKKSIKESFNYEGIVPIDTLMEILTEEWQENNTNNLLFRESSHYDDEARDEGKFIEISAIMEFDMPSGTGYQFSSKKVEKEYDNEVNRVYNEVGEDDEEYINTIAQYEPILFTISIDLKDEIIYADVDLGNGLSSTEVARESLADNEEDFRKQIQRMIESF